MNKIRVSQVVTYTLDLDEWAASCGDLTDGAEEDFLAYLDSGYPEDSLRAGMSGLMNAGGWVTAAGPAVREA